MHETSPDLYVQLDTRSLDALLAELPEHLHIYARHLVDKWTIQANHSPMFTRIAFPVKVAQSWYDVDHYRCSDTVCVAK